MNLIVIHEIDHEDNKQIVIGVADSIKNAELMIEEYYGKGEFEYVSKNDIRDCDIEYTRLMNVSGLGGKVYQVTVTLMNYRLNEV